MEKAAPTPAHTARRPSTRDGTGPATGSHRPVPEAQMRMVLDVSRLLAVPTDLDALLQKLAEACTELLGCERSSIFLHDPASNELWTKVALKSPPIRVPSHVGIVGHSFTNNLVVQVPEPYGDPRFNPEPDRRTGFVTRNLLSAPMKDLDGKPLGVIQAINKHGDTFSADDVALLQLLAEQAGVAIQRHNLQQAALEIVALRHEMDLARRTQEALIPKHPPVFPGYDAGGWTHPASTTGGDCFDLWKMSDGRLGLFLADASGHGLAPALIVSQARTIVRTLSDIEPHPHRVLGRANARLIEDLEWGQFVTAFLGFLSPDGVLHWSSAGHGPSLLRPTCGRPIELLEPPLQPLGVMSDWADVAPPPARIHPSGSLVLISDGVFEATDPAGAQVGIDRIVSTLDDQPDTCTPGEIIAAVRAAVRTWQAGTEAEDDQTLVVVQRRPPHAR
jgi:sigma-B regulation protein RsbU (phosphoserine phosphatase)